METDIETLAGRLRAVEDRLAIIELEAAYARAFDSRDGQAWAALFTADGIYQARGKVPGEPGAPQGREALAAYCSEAPFDGIHLPHLPQTSIDGDEARGRVHLEFLGRFHADGQTIRMIGYYDVLYRRVEGCWLIAHRVTTTFAADNRSFGGYPSDAAL